ncbi:MAG: glycosyltransferase family 4 protein [Chitinophagales bacterium]|nr:glycosyltransferase family 4 protein [Chitinophagales bacterium]
MDCATVNILFIGPHRPDRNGSQRFRMEQFFPYLEKAGCRCDYSWFLNERDDRIFYRRGNVLQKGLVLWKAIAIRTRDVLRAGRYDIVFIQREAFMTGAVWFEKMFARSGAKMIFDFDDAIWLEDTSEANQRFKWLKRPAKTAEIIAMANHVIAGNSYLAHYAEQYNRHVTTVPTVVDTLRYTASDTPGKAGKPVVIGWLGSSSTMKHFRLLLPVLEKLKEKYNERIIIKVVADKSSTAAAPWIVLEPWSSEREVELLRSFDIGVMPLPDDEWSKGKCGFKAIQYMAMKMPAVVSAVGVNTSIITHGRNGFIATSAEEWGQYLSMLIEDQGTRENIGLAARKTVEVQYSVQSQLPVLTALFHTLAGK